MKLFKLAATLLIGSCVVALAQDAAPSRPGAAGAQSGALPANANVVGSGPVVMPPPPANRSGGATRPRGDFTIHSRHLIYVTLPGSLERPMFPNGNGIVVLDADNNYASSSVSTSGTMPAAWRRKTFPASRPAPPPTCCT